MENERGICVYRVWWNGERDEGSKIVCSTLERGGLGRNLLLCRVRLESRLSSLRPRSRKLGLSSTWQKRRYFSKK